MNAPGRRRALRALGALALLPAAPACRQRLPADAVRVPLARLAAEGRVTVQWRGEPVELRPSATGPVARSLLCTHWGCPLQWEAARRRYLCPCHGGEFDDAGRPVAGPPNRPLASVPVEVAGGEAVLGLR